MTANDHYQLYKLCPKDYRALRQNYLDGDRTIKGAILVGKMKELQPIQTDMGMAILQELNLGSKNESIKK